VMIEGCNQSQVESYAKQLADDVQQAIATWTKHL
jgi:hypothetical protein